jgi:hypothetical protein
LLLCIHGFFTLSSSMNTKLKTKHKTKKIEEKASFNSKPIFSTLQM